MACPICDDTGWKAIDVSGVRRVVRCDCWKSGVAATLLSDARIPARYNNCDFSTFETNFDSHRDAHRRATEFADRFPVVDRGLLFYGPPGVGKTHLAQAIGYEAIKQGLLVRYRSIFDLVADFLSEEALAQRSRLMRGYLKPDLLIIDDMGLKQLPKHAGEYLLEVIMRRYENRSTVMTSNRPLEDWGKLLQDVPTAGAILDRFLHHAQVIAITGQSYRMKNAAAQRTAADANAS